MIDYFQIKKFPKSRVATLDMINGELKEREILHLSILMDHDVVDGVAMGRFIIELVKRIENFGS